VSGAERIGLSAERYWQGGKIVGSLQSAVGSRDAIYRVFFLSLMDGLKDAINGHLYNIKK